MGRYNGSPVPAGRGGYPPVDYVADERQARADALLVVATASDGVRLMDPAQVDRFKHYILTGEWK